MKLRKFINIFIILTILITTNLLAKDNKAKDFSLNDSHGKSHKLSDYKGKWVVLEWLSFGCPFVIKHYDSNNMQNLQKKYTGKGIVWLSICSSAEGKQGYYKDLDELNTKLKDYKTFNTSYLIDSEGIVGKMCDARTTPQIVIINPEGNIIYNGAIDDIKSTDVEDIKKAKNYVSTVLDEVLSGKPSPYSVTQPYGCSVKYK